MKAVDLRQVIVDMKTIIEGLKLISQSQMDLARLF